MKTLKLDGKSLTLGDLTAFRKDGLKVVATNDARRRVSSCAEFCAKTAADDEAHYGINTGFGEFARKRIPRESLGRLQKNLLRSHATGMGDDLPTDIVRFMMLLRVNSLLCGYSGVSLDVIDYMLAFINQGVTPVVPSHGSVGASGDLAPLAHMALPLIGEGTVDVKGKRLAGAKALEVLGLEPLELLPKEGLALINGTQLMSAYAAREIIRINLLVKAAMLAASMSLEAFEATDRFLDPRIQRLKKHPGQIRVAAGFRKIVESSEIILSHRNCDKVQDPYSFRCIPQVIGAVVDTLTWAEEWVTREINAVTDNPLLFETEREVLSGGNFHGEHMALALDAVALAVAEVAGISERRTDKLLDNDNDKLPQCLINEPGLNSGLMVTQYLSAALVSENKVYAHPASVDSIPTSAGFEDHVSMGSLSALKLARIVDNTARVIAVELLCAAQAIDFMRPLKGGKGTDIAHEFIRQRIPFIEQDTVMSGFLSDLESVVHDGSLVDAVENVLGDLLPGVEEVS